MHSPFTIREELVALDTGLVDIGHSLTCDKADEVGGDIQKEMDGQVYTDCSIKHSKQISTLQNLYASVNVGTEKVTIDPVTLFLRLIVLVERKPENEIVDHFRYEMVSYPMALFKDGIIRTAKKSKLKQLLIESVNSVEAPQTVRIIDGRALFWCCDWKKDVTFEIIFRRFSQFLLQLEIDIIVFDSYNMSTKDSTHQKRGGKKFQTVDIQEGNSCPSN